MDSPSQKEKKKKSKGSSIKYAENPRIFTQQQDSFGHLLSRN